MNIGQYQRDRSDRIRQQVAEYFAANPLAKQHECARDLGLALVTVSKHASALRAEWLAQRQQEQAGA